MNGRAARRIRRAAVQTNYASGSGEFRPTVKRLKREYLSRPYHKRNPTGLGYVSLSHKQQEQRWWRIHTYPWPPAPKPEPYVEPDFYDDHSRFRSLR